MALRDQPYFPLYVQDFMTDEKLMRCSASATGVYIRLLCHMHKSERYGVFQIKDKDRISDDVSLDFARVFTLFSPFSLEVVHSAFQELLDEGVLYIYRNGLCQKRMIKDGELSEKRASAGKKGMKKRYENSEEFCYNKTPNKVDNKSLTNTEYENEYEYESEIEDENITEIEKEYRPRRKKPSTLSKIQEERFNRFWAVYPRKVSIGDAEKAWGKIKPDDNLTNAIILAVDTAKRYDSRFREIKFTPHPATWLNGRGWESQYDGPEEPPPAARGKPGKVNTLGVLEKMLAEEGGEEP